MSSTGDRGCPGKRTPDRGTGDARGDWGDSVREGSERVSTGSDPCPIPTYFVNDTCVFPEKILSLLVGLE